jgi:hypothetical protein
MESATAQGHRGTPWKHRVRRYILRRQESIVHALIKASGRSEIESLSLDLQRLVKDVSLGDVCSGMNVSLVLFLRLPLVCLHTLDLTGQKMRDSGLQILASTLVSCASRTALINLGLQDNGLTCGSMDSLSLLASELVSLRCLDVSVNPELGEAGVAAVFAGATGNVALQFIFLDATGTAGPKKRFPSATLLSLIEQRVSRGAAGTPLHISLKSIGLQSDEGWDSLIRAVKQSLNRFPSAERPRGLVTLNLKNLNPDDLLSGSLPPILVNPNSGVLWREFENIRHVETQEHRDVIASAECSFIALECPPISANKKSSCGLM